MKNQIRYITILLMAVFIGSCEDEDKNPLPDFTKSSIPIFTPGDADSGFIDFLESDQSNIALSLDKDGLADVTSIDVTLTYNNSQTGASETVVYNTVTTLPSDVSITFDQLMGAFEPSVVTRDTLSLGDSFVVGGNVLLTDGRYLDGGYSTSVVANETVFVIYNVACASDLAGTYDLTLVSGNSGEIGALADQTITAIGPGYYEISDATMDIFGPDFPVKYRFTDICGTLIADAESVDFGNQIAIQFNAGTVVDPVTGEITFDIEYIAPSCCGLEGIKTVFKATRK